MLGKPHVAPCTTVLDCMQDAAEDPEGSPGAAGIDPPASQPQGIAIPHAATWRSRPVPVPGVVIHPSSAPSDSRLAWHPSRAFSPYTLHLAQHGKSQQHLPLESPEESWPEAVPVPRALPDPHHPVPGAAHRGSGSSGTSCASPLASSPAGGSPCRALVKHPSARGQATARPMCIAVDTSFEQSRRLLSSPEGIMRSSSGRSDVFSSRGWSPAAAGGDWGPLPHRQRLLEHPDQVRPPGVDACPRSAALSEVIGQLSTIN